VKQKDNVGALNNVAATDNKLVNISLIAVCIKA